LLEQEFKPANMHWVSRQRGYQKLLLEVHLLSALYLLLSCVVFLSGLWTRSLGPKQFWMIGVGAKKLVDGGAGV